MGISNKRVLTSIFLLAPLISACGGGGGGIAPSNSPTLPVVSIADSATTEGNSGTADARFTITMTAASTNDVSISYTSADDLFGYSLSLSANGNTLAVGAYGEASGVENDESDNTATSAGAVYVFNRNLNNWNQQAYLKASNVDVDDYFGRAVSLSANGNTLAVAARHEDSNAIGVGGDQDNEGAHNGGAAYIFTQSAGNWTQQAYIKASNNAPSAGDLFGRSISLSGDGNTLAVGADFEDSNATGIGGDQTDNTEANAGAVYLY